MTETNDTFEPEPDAGESDFVDDYDLLLDEIAREETAYLEASQTPEYAERLQHAARAYLDVERFEPGQLVRWKPGMRNQQLPAEDAPAVVLEYLAEPVAPADDSEAEDYDITLGIIDGSETLRVFAFPSRRFTAWD